MNMTLKQYIAEQDTKRIVSFDFDDTIAKKHEVDPGPDKPGFVTEIPNEVIINKIKEHIAQGDKVILVTTRYDQYMPEVLEFLKKFNIPIDPKDVHNTNMSWKANTLKKLGVQMHYDDNPDELRRLKHKGIRGVLVT